MASAQAGFTPSPLNLKLNPSAAVLHCLVKFLLYARRERNGAAHRRAAQRSRVYPKMLILDTYAEAYSCGKNTRLWHRDTALRSQNRPNEYG